MRERPFLAGVGGGVGTTTVAGALRGRDCGIYRAHERLHVLVCRSTMDSVGKAQRALQYTPQKPVLAVVDDVPNASVPTNTANRIRMTEGYVASIVRLPFVSDWRDLDAPHRHAEDLLVSTDEQSRGVRAYTDALRVLVDAIVAMAADPSDADPVVDSYTTAAFAGR